MSERIIVADVEEMSQRGANHMAEIIERAVQERKKCMIALSGGKTPRKLYERLASKEFESRIPWESTYWFFGDERHVPPDHDDSNYKMASDSLLSKVPIPTGNIHRIMTERPDPQAIALKYELTLMKAFNLAPGELPVFDLMFLGVGADGHIASLFPHSEALHVTTQMATANKIPETENWRITMTFPIINEAKQLLFLVAGEDKAEALRQVLEGPSNPQEFPAQLVRQKRGFQLWLIEKSASALLTQ
ncbi:MAG: 6-phosphogluconolactonase [Nitrospiraceae bacterium]|nr:6-phosphogluconolactonase [Nitrospiraceae bacterium]|tara:strand:+ start:8548 stop:9288 length:741 start_codon:yes stop_codon:yes gene_type:complete